MYRSSPACGTLGLFDELGVLLQSGALATLGQAAASYNQAEHSGGRAHHSAEVIHTEFG